MARFDTTLRILKVLHYLETSRFGYSVQELNDLLKQDGFDVSTKTVKRDLSVIESLDFPLVQVTVDSQSKWKFDSKTSVHINKDRYKEVAFTYPEIIAMYVAKNSLDHLKGSPVYEALNNFFLKIEKLLGKDCDELREFVGKLSFRPQMTWHTSVANSVMDTAYAGISEGHPLKIQYKAEGGEQAGLVAERIVGPECIYFANGGVYLIAKDLNKMALRTYSLSRIIEIELMTQQSYAREGVNPEDLFKETWGLLNTGEPENVELLIQGPISSYVVERRWHHSQETIKTPEGYLIKFKVKINDEFIRWILSLGSYVTVIAPDSVRQWVVKSAQKLIENNSKSKAA